MLDQISNLLSKEAALGIVAVSAVAYLAAGPLSERITMRDHLPACRNGELSPVGARRLRSPEDVVRDTAIDVLKQSGDLGRLVGGWIDGARRAQEQNAAAIDAATCGCRMRLALAETRSEWALHVATLKLYSPPAVTTFGAVMASIAAERCGGRS